MSATSTDMLIKQHKMGKASKESFLLEQDLAKDLGNKEGWTIVWVTIGTAQAKLYATDVVKNEPMIMLPG